ncbi:MAG: ABC transporter ATP-binding protein [Chloroflexota bacterium]
MKWHRVKTGEIRQALPVDSGSGAPSPMVVLEKVSKSYFNGDIEVKALSEVSFEIMPAEFIVLLGPSGSGKTTLLNLIGGLDSPTSGKIVVDGVTLTGLSADKLTGFRRNHIGFVFQFFNLISTLTAKENVELASELIGNHHAAQEILREVGLGERMNHFPSELSGGENQRVAIARALATDTPLILCDEPTGSLDSETGKHIFSLLVELNEKRGKTIIVVTHNSTVGKIAHRVIRLRDGRVTDIIQNSVRLQAEELTW